ncbi:hypothetical protein ACFFK0_16690 [Paenibacillus chartarius]|uniref:Lipoprotein n=1 Tax=Paenibacillus chartarius TaxID=747481 RepID=A0ABV6DN56_9BACL
MCKTVLRGLFIGGMLLAGAALAAGCGVSEKAVQTAVEKTTGVKVDEKDNSITVTGKDGEKVEISTDSGKVPEGFPFTILPGGKVESSLASTENGAKSYVVSVSSRKPIKEVAAYYAEALKSKGIEAERTELTGDAGVDTVILAGKSDKMDATVQIYNGDSIGTEGYVANIMVKVAE